MKPLANSVLVSDTPCISCITQPVHVNYCQRKRRQRWAQTGTTSCNLLQFNEWNKLKFLSFRLFTKLLIPEVDGHSCSSWREELRLHPLTHKIGTVHAADARISVYGRPVGNASQPRWQRSQESFSPASNCHCIICGSCGAHEPTAQLRDISKSNNGKTSFLRCKVISSTKAQARHLTGHIFRKYQ